MNNSFRLSIRTSLVALFFVVICLFSYAVINIEEYSPVESRNYDLITSNFSPMFSLFGTNYGFTDISDDTSRYDFGGGNAVIFDKVISRESSHWHKILFGLYRESDSHLN